MHDKTKQIQGKISAELDKIPEQKKKISKTVEMILDISSNNLNIDRKTYLERLKKTDEELNNFQERLLKSEEKLNERT